MTKRTPTEPTRWLDDPQESELAALLRNARLDEGPGPGAKERAWRRMSRAPIQRPRSVLWIPASAVALVVVVSGAFWLARARSPEETQAMASTTQRLSTPPSQTASLRFGAFDVHLAANSQADVVVTGEALTASLHRGELAVRQAAGFTGATAVVEVGTTRIEGADFTVRRAPDGAWNVDAAADGVYVREGEEVVRLSRGQSWPERAPDAVPAAAPRREPEVTLQTASQARQPTSIASAHGAVSPSRTRPSRAVPSPPTPVVPDRGRETPPSIDLPSTPDIPVSPLPYPVVAPAGRPDVPRESPPASNPVAGSEDVPTDPAREWAEANRLVRSGDPAAAVRKLDAIARGTGPHAELALYEAGRVRVRFLEDPAGARRDFVEYRARYPNGALRLEADLSIVETLVAQKRAPEAIAEADAFLKRHARSERAAEVRWIRAHLLRDSGKWQDARADYLALADSDPAGAAEALFQAAVCDQELGDAAQARVRLESWLERFPDGRRRAEVERALGR